MSVTPVEIDRLEQLMGRKLPVPLVEWLLMQTAKELRVQVNCRGEAEILICGFKPMYNRYNNFHRNKRKASRYQSVGHLIFMGHFERAQDLGYIYVDPEDTDLGLQEYSDDGELQDDLFDSFSAFQALLSNKE